MRPKLYAIGLLLLAATVAGTAVGAETAPTDLKGVIGTVRDTLLETWRHFLEHTPYLAAGLVIIILTWGIAAAAGNISLRLLQQSQLRGSLKSLLSRFVVIGTWVLGLLMAAMVVFPGLTPAKALGAMGIASVAVGFAFKDIFENFFAGILLLWRFPFENGDFIECEGITGRVEDVSIRMTQVRKTNDELVVLPNSFLFKNPVRILTNRKTRRITVMTGVAYDEDVGQAVRVITEALEGCQTVDKTHPVQIFPNGFGSSSIDIEVTWWCGATPLEFRKSRGEVVAAVKKALDDAGIEIPFPYRTLTFKEPLQTKSVENDSDS